MALSRGIRLHQHLDDWLIRAPVSGKSTSKHSDSGGPNSVLRVDNKSGEVRTKTYSMFSFMGYEYHLDLALVKRTQERFRRNF